MLKLRCKFIVSSVRKWKMYLLEVPSTVDLAVPEGSMLLMRVGDTWFVGKVRVRKVKVCDREYRYKMIYVPTHVGRTLVDKGITPGSEVEAHVLAVIDPKTKLAVVDAPAVQ